MSRNFSDLKDLKDVKIRGSDIKMLADFKVDNAVQDKDH